MELQVIYRGKCFKDYNSTPAALKLLQQEFSLNDQTVFSNFSRLHKGKGQADLIKAFNVLRLEVLNIVLLIAGEGSFRQGLTKLIEAHDLVESVFLLGYREDVAELLALADYFVFPTYFEGLPGALIEAIISGTPSIVSDIEENKECFNGKNALFFETGNIRDLKTKMKQALKLENWDKMTEAGLLNAHKNFEIGKVSLEYENFYKSILQSSLNKKESSAR